MLKYRNITIDENEENPPFGVYKIDKLRSLINVELPESFEEFVRVAGGKSICEYGFKINPYEGTFAFPEIYSLYNDFGEYNLIDELINAREELEIPNEVIPFASVLNGPHEGVMYLDLTESGNGKIIVFATGKPEWVGRNTEDDWLDVAKSFDEYLELLFEELNT